MHINPVAVFDILLDDIERIEHDLIKTVSDDMDMDGLFLPRETSDKRREREQGVESDEKKIDESGRSTDAIRSNAVKGNVCKEPVIGLSATMGTDLSIARRLCHDMRYVKSVIVKVSEERDEYGFAMSAMLLTGARRGEIREMEIFMAPYQCRVRIPTLKQRRNSGKALPVRDIIYPNGTPGYEALRRIASASGCRGWYDVCKPFAMLSVQGLADAVRRARTDGDSGMTLHTLRHIFATQARRDGWGARELSAAMGHARSASTARYGA